MKKSLQQLNQAQGVIGSFVSDKDGRISAVEFPPIFDRTILDPVAALLMDNLCMLDSSVGTVGLLDLRFSNARVVVKPLSDGFVVLLCENQINMLLLKMFLAIAVKKIEIILAKMPAPLPVLIPLNVTPSRKDVPRLPSWPSL